MLTTVEKDCNIIFRHIIKWPIGSMKTIDDVVNETKLSKEQVELCHSKLYREGMGRAGKGYFLINDVCREFAERGGYKDSDVNPTTKSIHIYGDGNVVNQDSFLENSRQSAVIEKYNSKSAQNPPNKSLLERLWKMLVAIIGTIAALIAIYEFIIKKG